MLLGLWGDRNDSNERGWWINKFGGDPDYFRAASPDLQCKICQKESKFLCQLYCPLERSKYHRTLHVFVCLEKSCLKKNSWLVVRSLMLDEGQLLESGKPFEAKNSSNIESWCEGAEDWTGDVAVEENSDLLKSFEALLSDHSQASDGACIPHSKTKKASLAEAHEGSAALTPSFYMDVIEEPEEDCALHPNSHEQKLLSRYEKEHGVKVADLCLDESETEKYERAKAGHGDITFQKFHKRVKRHPSQCVRYQRNGDPLFVKNNLPVVSPCAQCGSPRIFELQLMPALIHYALQTWGKDIELDYGTVLIYTCQLDCEKAESGFLTELAFSQSEETSSRPFSAS